MTRINCSGKDCKAFVEVESASPGATYTCRVHTGDDTKNQGLRFQPVQFDHDLDNSAKPLGTNHIHHQGNKVWTKQEIDLIRYLDRD